MHKCLAFLWSNFLINVPLWKISNLKYLKPKLQLWWKHLLRPSPSPSPTRKLPVALPLLHAFSSVSIASSPSMKPSASIVVASYAGKLSRSITYAEKLSKSMIITSSEDAQHVHPPPRRASPWWASFSIHPRLECHHLFGDQSLLLYIHGQLEGSYSPSPAPIASTERKNLIYAMEERCHSDSAFTVRISQS